MPSALQCRGDCVESVHPWSAVAVDGGAGEVVWSTGSDPITTWRSSLKPLQLACALEVLDDPPIEDELLAVGAASHSAEATHVTIVERILARFELTERDLRCGAHAPMSAAAAGELLRTGRAPTQLHNNCSGKHAFMAAATRRAGWPADYRPAAHPLQARVLARTERASQAAAPFAIDGCGVPTPFQPLSAIARAWASIAAAMRASDGDARPSPDEARLGRIGWAMARRPDLTSGSDRFDRELVRLAREPMAVKIGAMGLFCLALPARGLGIAVKVESGNADALAVAVPECLAAAAPGAWEAPPGWPLREVRNVVGDPVGAWRAV
ncbi:MAG: asparaginase [Polyangiaceae bacterium]|nr:asparaginase [Polyangiaceae bacterium]